MDDHTYQAFERLIASRRSVKQLVAYMKEVDVRPLLPEIQCPSLVIHYAGDLAVPHQDGPGTCGRAAQLRIPRD